MGCPEFESFSDCFEINWGQHSFSRFGLPINERNIGFNHVFLFRRDLNLRLEEGQEA